MNKLILTRLYIIILNLGLWTASEFNQLLKTVHSRIAVDLILALYFTFSFGKFTILTNGTFWE